MQARAPIPIALGAVLRGDSTQQHMQSGWRGQPISRTEIWVRFASVGPILSFDRPTLGPTRPNSGGQKWVRAAPVAARLCQSWARISTKLSPCSASVGLASENWGLKRTHLASTTCGFASIEFGLDPAMCELGSIKVWLASTKFGLGVTGHRRLGRLPGTALFHRKGHSWHRSSRESVQRRLRNRPTKFDQNQTDGGRTFPHFARLGRNLRTWSKSINCGPN